MFYFKGQRVSLKKCEDFLINQSLKQNGKKEFWGFMFRWQNEIIAQKGFYSAQECISFLKRLQTERGIQIDMCHIAFCQNIYSDVRDAMPCCISNDMQKVSFIQEYDNTSKTFGEIPTESVIMLECENKFCSSSRYTAEKNYIENVLGSFDTIALREKIQFLGQYGVFDNVSFIILNKYTGFKFIGKFATINGSISNGEIIRAKKMVALDEFYAGR